MSAARSERLMNLLITLLVARHPVPKDKLRDIIEDYRKSTAEGFEKMFERDKEELRAVGIPIVVEPVDKFFDDEVGYRIHRNALELPPIELTPDEAAVVGLAARVWQHAGLADATSQAVLKLAAGGAEVDRTALDIVQPAVVAHEASFDALWNATSTRTPVSFSYRRRATDSPKPRQLDPWGMVTARGRWYVVGFDRDRAEPRMFRLSRIVGDVETAGKPGSFEVPADTDIRQLSGALSRGGRPGTAVLKVAADRGNDLRRRGLLTQQAAGWDTISIEYSDEEAFIGEVLSNLDAVEVVSPAKLKEAVVGRLRTLAGAR